MWTSGRGPRPGLPIAGLLAAIVLGGCALGPRRIALPPSESIPDHRAVEVWRDGKVSRIQQIVFDVDSLRGRRAGTPSDCDSCTVAVAIAAIDSLRLGRDEQTGRLLVGIPVTAFALVTMVWGMSATE